MKLIEIHMIQNHSPANLNRDDLGAPKTCLFGGVPRARISSQCLKRSIRNPGNPQDTHSPARGLFAEAMSGHMGTKTKFFPWLVEQELRKSGIPENEHRRIILAAQRIGIAKEKEEKKASGSKADLRPKTAQLIHLGPGHAKYFVNKLSELRTAQADQYAYFLRPDVGFQEMVRTLLDDLGLSDQDKERVVKSSWTIANCRMSELLKVPAGQNPDPEPESEDGQPGPEHARLIAERMTDLRSADEDRFKDLIKQPTPEEKKKIKEDAPKKPKGMDSFMTSLKAAGRYDAADIALFGRMTTSDAFEDVEAAMQVAHAISTHVVVNQVDYFTAVDDLGKTGGGAGHVDEGMFNSACFYKYFSLDWDQLVSSLAGPKPDEAKDRKAHKEWVEKVKPHAEKLAAATVGHFLRAAAMTTPSGKQNSFAAHNEPCGILVEIKNNGTPTSYANAFAEPVERIGKPDDDTADEKSIEGRSVACLADHVQALRRAYSSNSRLLWYSPKLWRYPLQYWQRAEDGKKLSAQPVTDDRFDVLEGKIEEDGKSGSFVEAVVKAVGFDWSSIKNVGKTSPDER